MRATLDIAEDVFHAVKDRARREKRSAGDVLSDLAREAMAGEEREAPADEEPSYGFHPFLRRGPRVTNELIDRLREATDD
jgi:hypothetical protein